MASRAFIDLSPLKRSRDFRLLMGGQLISIIGTQLTAVAVPFQVYRITHSSLMVGLVSLAQLFPLLATSLLGGSLIDALDRRRLLVIVESAMALCSVGLALNSDFGPWMVLLFVFPAISAGLTGLDVPTRNAMIPSLVPKEQLHTAAAMFQMLVSLGAVAGPAVGGALLSATGGRVVYWIDAASFAGPVVAVLLMRPQSRPQDAPTPGLRSVIEGFTYLKGRQGVQGAYLIDINAMVFGMPRALFPALALGVFGGGASTLGLLYAAPSAGAVLGASTTGWVSGIKRPGRAVILAVVVWGAAIAGFGLVPSLWPALALLVVAGWADVVSAVLRNTIIQLSVPDNMRGRLLGFQIGVVQGGPRLGDLEAGGVASAFGNEVSVVSGGLACIAGALILAFTRPGFSGLEMDINAQADPGGDVERAEIP